MMIKLKIMVKSSIKDYLVKMLIQNKIKINNKMLLAVEEILKGLEDKQLLMQSNLLEEGKQNQEQLIINN